MATQKERLIVLINGEQAGELKRAGSKVSFTYSDTYVAQQNTPLSTGFPLQQNRDYDGQRVVVWLEGLLPDNDNVLQAWRTHFDAKDKSAFALLSTSVGHDCAGAVQFCRQEDVAMLQERNGYVEWLSANDLKSLVIQLRSPGTTWHDLGARIYQGRFSLSGAQAKTALVKDGDKLGIPRGALPSTVILKPTMTDPNFPDQALNEHLCLSAASSMGLLSAKTEILELSGTQCILIKRYDRLDINGVIHRVHQEDMCQALGVPVRNKYQDSRGPSPIDIVTAIRRHVGESVLDVARFTDALIYNWLLAATDGHAKNYSFLLSSETIRLAPLYDIASFLPYLSDMNELPDLKLAMRVAKRYEIEKHDELEAWSRFATSIGVDEDAVLGRGAEMARCLPEAFQEVVSSLPKNLRTVRTVQTLLNRVEDRAKQCFQIFNRT